MFSKSISDDAELQLIQPHHAEELYSLVDANRELIARFEKKIQATLARIWGEES